MLSGSQLSKLEDSIANSFRLSCKPTALPVSSAGQELSYICVPCNSRYGTDDLLIITLFSSLAGIVQLFPSHPCFIALC